MQVEIIEKLRKLEDLCASYEDVIGSDAKDIRKEYGLLSTDEMCEYLAELEEKNRLLNIGIIGRVKAGKSSLLNTVFFNGESILPEAATPMTAALTVLTYGEEFSASVDFFSKSDIDIIHREHDEYEKERDKKYNEEEAKERENARRRNTVPNLEKARKRVDSEMRESNKAASHGQYERMLETGKINEFERVNETQIIDAPVLKDLLGKLEKYVGSTGASMPFTKSVELRIPIDSLKNIQIVDTPGINDPVKSREKRTEDYLGKCDVVFIVSPSGQFINSADMNLMDRLSTRERVKELYLVASQVDNQLYGLEILEKAENNLHSAINDIHSDLFDIACKSLVGLKQKNPEIGDQFDQLIEGGKDRIIITSAICQNMSIHFNDKKSWNENMNLVWENLNENYPDYFGDGEIGKSSLDKISNVQAVSNKIDHARQEKDRIMAEKQRDYMDQQHKNIKDFKVKMQKAVVEKINYIETTDVEKIENQKMELRNMISKGTSALDESFEDSIEKLKHELHDTISKNSKGLFAGTGSGIEERKETETVTRKRAKNGWWSGVGQFFGGLWGYEDYTTEITTIRTGAVKKTLNNLVDELEDNLINSLNDIKLEWKTEIQKNIIRALREAIKDDNTVDGMMFLLKNALRRVVGNLQMPEFSMADFYFNSEKTGILKDQEADTFIEEIDIFLGHCKTRYRKLRDAFINEIEATLKGDKMSDLVFGELRDQLNKFEEEITNKKLTLKRLNDFQDTLQKTS
jgi:hypothetical protein